MRRVLAQVSGVSDHRRVVGVTAVFVAVLGGALPVAGGAPVHTVAPAFVHQHMAVKSGKTLRVSIRTHAQWEQPEACRLGVTRSGFRNRHFSYAGVVSDLVFELPRRRQDSRRHLAP